MRRFSMVDISAKKIVPREAIAVGEIRLKPATIARIKSGSLEKGDAIAAAEVAAIMAAKNTPGFSRFATRYLSQPYGLIIRLDTVRLEWNPT